MFAVLPQDKFMNTDSCDNFNRNLTSFLKLINATTLTKNYVSDYLLALDHVFCDKGIVIVE